MKRKDKKGGKFFIIISVIIVIVLVFIGFVIFGLYKDVSEKEPAPQQSSSTQQQSKTPSQPRKPSRCSLVNDTYEKPDFKELTALMAQQPIIQDFPKKGSMRLRFFHFIEGCRKWDKAYYASGGEIFEKNMAADVDVWIHTDYAFRLTSNNLCDLIIEARNNGDLGQWTELSTTKLMWTYKGMLKYKDCLGIGGD